MCVGHRRFYLGCQRHSNCFSQLDLEQHVASYSSPFTVNHNIVTEVSYSVSTLTETGRSCEHPRDGG